MLALLGAVIVAFAPSSEDAARACAQEARDAEQLLRDGFHRDATMAFQALAKAHADDVCGVGYALDIARAAQGFGERRQIVRLLEHAVERAGAIRRAHALAVDEQLRRNEPFLREWVGSWLDQTSRGCSAFIDNDLVDGALAAYIALYPSSPFAGDALLVRAQRALWAGFDDAAAQPLFAAAAAHALAPGFDEIARECASHALPLPGWCGGRADGGRLVDRSTWSPDADDRLAANIEGVRIFRLRDDAVLAMFQSSQVTLRVPSGEVEDGAIAPHALRIAQAWVRAQGASRAP